MSCRRAGDGSSHEEPLVIPRVGDRAQLWSRTAGRWCEGSIAEVELGMTVRLVVEYGIPGVGAARKVVLPSSVNIRFPEAVQGQTKPAASAETAAATGGAELEGEEGEGEGRSTEDDTGDVPAGSESSEDEEEEEEEAEEDAEEDGPEAATENQAALPRAPAAASELSRKPPLAAKVSNQMPKLHRDSAVALISSEVRADKGEVVELVEGAVVGDGRFELHHKLGSGSFSTVRLATDFDTGEEVALKLERTDSKFPQLIEEARRYKHLTDGTVLPRMHWYGTDAGYNIMAMDVLGPSLEAMFESSCRQLGLSNVVRVALQMLDCLEFVHSRDYIHRDLKPNNFCMGAGGNSSQVYCIDFGLAKRYRAPVSLGRTHIPFRGGLSFVGTLRYASIGAQLGEEQSRRDDLQSFAYIVLYLLQGSLPWQGLGGTTKEERRQLVLEVKQSLCLEELCDHAPTPVFELVYYVTDLAFGEAPDYELLRQLLRAARAQEGGGRSRSESLGTFADGASEQ